MRVETNAKQVAERVEGKQRKIKRGLSTAIHKAGLLVERHSKQLAPVRTGRLRASIQTTTLPMVATIMPTVNYAVYVHEGTRYMTGRPFMKRGRMAAEAAILSVFQKEVRDAVK